MHGLTHPGVRSIFPLCIAYFYLSSTLQCALEELLELSASIMADEAQELQHDQTEVGRGNCAFLSFAWHPHTFLFPSRCSTTLQKYPPELTASPMADRARGCQRRPRRMGRSGICIPSPCMAFSRLPGTFPTFNDALEKLPRVRGLSHGQPNPRSAGTD